MTALSAIVQTAVWRRLARRAPRCLPDLAAFTGAMLCAGACALLVSSLGGCGGGVGSEGTGTIAGSSFGSGTIAGFGSIIVNGVHYDERTAVVDDADGKPVDRSGLALGMVVQVSGGAISTAADGTLVATATTVRTNRALVGPVGAVDAAGGTLTLLGQTVRVNLVGTTVFDLRLAGGLAGIRAGQVLEVYGFYDPSLAAYVATRIAPSDDSVFRVSGPVAAVGAQSFQIGSQTYVGSTAGLSAGTQVRLAVPAAADGSGRWAVEGRRDDDKLPDDDRDGAGLDGVVAALLPNLPNQPSGRFSVAGITVDPGAARVSGTLAVGARVEVRGSLRAGVLVASELKFSAVAKDAAGNAGDVRTTTLKGSLSALDPVARRFLLRGTLVDYSRSDLQFSKGSAATLVGFSGTLEVKGLLSADGTRLDATEIKFED